MTLNEFIERFEYKSDGLNKDHWKILKADSDGKFRGDCEDFSLTVLWILCGESRLKFWYELILGNARLRHVTTNGGGHAVLEIGKEYIDNWTMKFVHQSNMQELGHVFTPKFYRWYHVLYKLTF